MGRKTWRPKLLFVTLALLFIAAILLISNAMNGSIPQNTDRVTYKNRTYLNSNRTIDQNTHDAMKKMFDQTRPTGKYVKGMEVYDIEDNPYNSTVIFLKREDGSFLVYSLSGGP